MVLGDLILDRYIEGHVKRISPEAPVPVLCQTSDRAVLGGAGNVANNISALGGIAHLVGVLGKDNAADVFCSAARQLGIQLHFVQDINRITTVKTRILGDRQQLLRVDNEDVKEISGELEFEILRLIKQLIQGKDAVIISDYRKGLLTTEVLRRTIQLANELSIPVMVDPKGSEFNNYLGADFIKPNRAELELLTNIQCTTFEHVAHAASHLREKTNSNILVTLSQDGMILFKRDGSTFSLSTEAKEVFDVSGAGDTAIASFAFAVAHGETPENATRFANIASGISVSKIGTAVVSFDEISLAFNKISDQNDKISDVCVDLSVASEIRNNWAHKGLTVGFTNGCFDLLHPGHIALLRGAAEKCDRLIVGLNSDNSVRRLKGSERPIQSELARAEVLGALEYVDIVVIFDEDTPLETIKSIRPDILVKGSDYEEADIVGADFVKGYGGKVIRIGLRPGHSTTSLVNRSKTNLN